MSYIVETPRKVSKVIDRFPAADGRRILEAIEALGTEPRPPQSEPLTGRPGWKRRVGDYRIVYVIDDKQQRVLILDVGQRGRIYR